jgi:hypothetical protein
VAATAAAVIAAAAVAAETAAATNLITKADRWHTQHPHAQHY